MAVDSAPAADCHQHNLFFIARLKAYRRTCGNVQAHPVSQGSIKMEGTIDLKEMVMAAHLHGPVAGIADDETHSFPPCVECDRPGSLIQQVFTWVHGVLLQRIGSCIVTNLVPSGKVASTCTSWIISGIPSIRS